MPFLSGLWALSFYRNLDIRYRNYQSKVILIQIHSTLNFCNFAPMNSLVDKYNIPGPRYTSYPTVPYWNEADFTANLWKKSVIRSFSESNSEEGIPSTFTCLFARRFVRFVRVTRELRSNIQ